MPSVRFACGERRTTISYAIGRGVLVKALTTMLGFGTLMISTERGLIGLGFILTLGVGGSMLTALIFLPAVLRLFGGGEAAITSLEPLRLGDMAQKHSLIPNASAPRR